VAGWNTSTAQFQALLVDAMSVVEAGGELAHCWVLRGHPVGCGLGTALGLAGLTRSVALFVGCGCGGGVRVGVWLCVECCIVDASILLWSSV
jgi:hypothetical protein